MTPNAPSDRNDSGAHTDRSDSGTYADRNGPSALYGIDASDDELRAALRDGEVTTSVFGLGKMGLPLAAVVAERTGDVIGVDIDPDVVDRIDDGACPVEGEPGLDSLVASQVRRGRLRATTDGVAAATRASVHVILVPTLVTAANEPDLSALQAAVETIADGLAAGDLVIVESTVPPRVPRDVIEPILLERSGLEPGSFGVAVCPERTSSGTALRDIQGRYPKVVGGIDDESARAAAILYGEVTDGEIDVVGDATTAAAVKVFEGIYRDVNIALANELATTARELGISVREAIATANELPVCDLHDPGPGVGGHCIPNYPHFVRAETETPTPLLATARRVNDRMPVHAVDAFQAGLEADGPSLSEASVGVFGLTYRPGVAELRKAPALDAIAELEARGATVVAIDPLVDAATVEAALESRRSNGDGPATETTIVTDRATVSSLDLDAAMVVTPHDAFDDVAWDRLDLSYLFDGREGLAFESPPSTYDVLGGRTEPADRERASPSGRAERPVEDRAVDDGLSASHE
ncbi:nucleotide sugar dehydrogenase [Halovivax limisalsi]|uniref:nucleotide sugar dehydrogenase n=1 Tax=Halovivax limisalsi TaxID=1453760 RepID=UPI001FFD1931|nr:nucleotide sugar dehydrogenase [Halovivax limisalsi]